MDDDTRSEAHEFGTIDRHSHFVASRAHGVVRAVRPDTQGIDEVHAHLRPSVEDEGECSDAVTSHLVRDRDEHRTIQRSAKPHVVRDENIAYADAHRSRSWMWSRRAEIGASFDPGIASNVGKLRLFGTRGPIDEHRDVEFVSGPPRELVPRATRIIHRRAAERYERNDVDDTETRMFAVVSTDREQIDRGPCEPTWSVLADERVDAAVMMRIGMSIEKVVATRGIESCKDGEITPFAHVDDALEHAITLPGGGSSGCPMTARAPADRRGVRVLA